MLRKLSLTFLGLIAALIAAAAVVPMFVTPNHFKAPIMRQLEAATGYQINLGGDIALRVLPFPKLRAQNVSVSGPYSGGKAFAQLEALDVGVQLMPLLRGKVAITGVSLKKPVLNLRRDKNGDNWQPATQKRVMEKGEQNPASSAKPMPATVPNIALDGVEIESGTLSYRDMVGGTAVALSNLDLKVGLGSLSSPVELKGKAVLNGKPVTLKGNFGSLKALQGKESAPLSLAFSSEPLVFAANGTVADSAFTGDVEVNSSSLTAAIAWLTGQKPKNELVVRTALKGKARCSATRCGVAEAKLEVDDMAFTGSASVDMASSKPSFTADLATDSLNISPYLQPSKHAQLELISSAYAADARWSSAPMDLSGLNAANGNIALRAGKFTAKGFSADNVVTHVKLVGGTLTADAVGSLYQGKGNGMMTLANTGYVDGNIALENVAMQPLLKAVSDYDKFSGTLAANVTFKGNAKSEQALVSSLNGNGSAKILNGSIKGVDIASMVRNVQSAFKEVDTSKRQTDFAEMGGTFTITNGVVGNNDLMMKAPLFRVAGAGKVDLPNYMIDYKLTPQIVDTLKGQGGKDKEGLAVPILITGSLDHPQYAPDVRGIVEDAVKNPEKFKENLKDAKEFLKDKNSVKDLKKLFKGL